jgi:hypothetical protein
VLSSHHARDSVLRGNGLWSNLPNEEMHISTQHAKMLQCAEYASGVFLAVSLQRH